MEIDELPDVGTLAGDRWALDLDATAHQLFGAGRRGLLRAGSGVVLAFRHDDVRGLAVHPDIGNTPTHVLMERAGRRNASEHAEGGFAPIIANQVFTFNPPLHTETRRILTRQFTPGNVGRLAPLATTVIDGVLDTVRHLEHVDLVRDIAEPISARFWGHLIGFDEGEIAAMQDLLPTLSTVFLARLDRAQCTDLDRAVRHYMDLVTTAARQSLAGDRPCDDVGRAMLAEMAGDLGRVTSAGAPKDIGFLAAGNFFDGFHTVGVGLANAACLLLRHARWTDVTTAPSLAAAAYDEGTRIASPLVLTHRYALADVVHGDVRIPAGTLVAMHWSAANLDPAIFDRPRDYDLDRHQRGLMTFGTGPHLCPGRNVARLVGELGLQRLTHQLPGLTMDDAAPRWTPHASATQLLSCPLTNRTSGALSPGR